MPLTVIKLVWEAHWFQEEGPREQAVTPFGDTYLVSESGWWFPLDRLHKCDGMDAAKAGAQADFDAKVRECVV